MEKTKTVLLSIFYLIVLTLKGVWARIFYPVAYLFYDWTMKGAVRRNYTIPESVSKNPIKWFFWLHYDDAAPKHGAEWFTDKECKKLGFRCAYKWNTRNSMYNVNYNYMSNQSHILHHTRSFGEYHWSRKLRRKYGDLGSQLVWFTTEKEQYRFLFSMAKVWFNKDITFYLGWNANYNGRFTASLKVR